MSSVWGTSSGSMIDRAGYREFVNRLTALIRYYNRHKAVIDDLLPSVAVDPWQLVAAAEVIIEATNLPGPD